METITIETERFGVLTVDGGSIINFVKPILGFESLQQYVLLNHDEDSPFKWLQAIDKPDLAFVVTNPKLFGINYEFEITDNIVQDLALKDASDALVLTMVNIPQEAPEKMTTNLLGPIIIHQSSLRAMQVVLNDTEFSTKTRLIQPELTTETTQTEKVSLERGD